MYDPLTNHRSTTTDQPQHGENIKYLINCPHPEEQEVTKELDLMKMEYGRRRIVARPN